MLANFSIHSDKETMWRATNLVVCPRDDFALDDGGAVLVQLGEEGEGVGAHKLPNKSQR